MASRFKRRESLSPLHIAGWLFADLAVILMVIFLAVGTDHPVEANAEPDPIPSATPEPSEEPEDTGMSVDPIITTLTTNTSKLRDGDGKALKKLLLKEFGDLETDGEHAAVVLTFGGTHDANVGADIAAHANKVMRSALPDFMELVSSKGTRNYWDGKLDADEIRFEVFLHVKDA
ncbi:hypothetical protein FB566_0017 [Stackebrandtia endophytica]|uniref:Uncharacterized protein n=2 Tax=Stackebrandtia endophytica TaxID=1496996 RepID=A0A543APN3_9ACTN|nr:hypothetical protein FB566_0017 [Stackebrandtia endophytica]